MIHVSRSERPGQRRARTASEPKPAPSLRRVTQPRRTFDPSRLASLPRGRRRQLCQLLLTESGGTISEYQAPVAYDELVIEVTPLWVRRTVRVRISTRVAGQSDIDQLAERVAEAGDSDGVLFAPLGVERQVNMPARTSLVSPEEIIARLERSPLILWRDQEPFPAYERIAIMRDLERNSVLIDTLGIRWLPALALNELPAELVGEPVAPQDLFERVAFRMLTSTFRFGGRRYGEAARGRGLPDSVLTWPAGAADRFAAVFDSKAASSGYLMESDHLLRFQRYVSDARDEVAKEGYELRYVWVLSSSFPGPSGARHPFHARARALRKTVGVELAYTRAVDLARLAFTVEAQQMDPADRERLDWSRTLSGGLLEAEAIQEMIPEGKS